MSKHTPLRGVKQRSVQSLLNHDSDLNIPRLGLERLRRTRALKELRATWELLSRDAFIPAFKQRRTAVRASEVAGGMLFSTITGTIADSIRARGLDQEDGSADMHVLPRMKSPHILFHGVFKTLIPLFPEDGPIVLAIDDTVLPKRGKKMAYTRWCHNPLVPPWQHSALMNGHPVFHAAVIVYDSATKKPLAITVAFEPVEGLPPELKKKRRKKGKGGKAQGPGSGTGRQSTPPAKPGRPTKEEAARRKEEKRKLRERYPTAPDVAVAAIQRFRQWMDEAGMVHRQLIVVGDGSYTNATVFFSLPERCVYVGRTRPDATLETIGKRTASGKFMYGPLAPKPKVMATDKAYPAQMGSFVYGGDVRALRYKEVGPLTRRNSTRKKWLRLLLLRPVTYYSGGKAAYSHEAFLLTSDHTTPAETLIQAYLWRWAIEVNHRNSKTSAKIGQAQARVAKSVINVHPAMAAAFSLLWVSVLRMNGGSTRTEFFLPLASWQKANLNYRQRKRREEGKSELIPRASAMDVLDLFREAVFGHWKNGRPRMKPRAGKRQAV